MTLDISPWSPRRRGVQGEARPSRRCTCLEYRAPRKLRTVRRRLPRSRLHPHRTSRRTGRAGRARRPVPEPANVVGDRRVGDDFQIRGISTVVATAIQRISGGRRRLAVRCRSIYMPGIGTSVPPTPGAHAGREKRCDSDGASSHYPVSPEKRRLRAGRVVVHEGSELRALEFRGADARGAMVPRPDLPRHGNPWPVRVSFR